MISNFIPHGLELQLVFDSIQIFEKLFTRILERHLEAGRPPTGSAPDAIDKPFERTPGKEAPYSVNIKPILVPEVHREPRNPNIGTRALRCITSRSKNSMRQVEAHDVATGARRGTGQEKSLSLQRPAGGC